MPRRSAKLISDMYQRALAVPEPERAAFLDRECSSDPALRIPGQVRSDASKVSDNGCVQHLEQLEWLLELIDG